MQRVLVILVVILLVTASLGAGALAANWPFWSRAWQWHVAGGDVPSITRGPRVTVPGGAVTPLAFDSAGSELTSFATGAASTTMLLRLREGRAELWHAPSLTPAAVHAPLDGRGLGVAVLAPLFEALSRRHPGLLDRPVGAWLDAWRQDARGAHTPRELLAMVEHGVAAAPAPRPLNPFRATARLASGPDFQEAGLALFESGDREADGGSGDRMAAVQQAATQQAAAAQVLAAIATAVEQRPFAAVLADVLWTPQAQGDASLLLDRRRGSPALHCCVEALPADWLRVGQWVGALAAAGGPSAMRSIVSSGRVLMARGTDVLLWVGEGPIPSGLETLLGPAPTPADQ